MSIFFVLFLITASCSAVIYRLNDDDYYRMPPLNHLDDFAECLERPGAEFCYSRFALVSENTSELLSMIQEFSEHYTHYNHSQLHYGYCVTRKCKKHFNKETVDKNAAFEACLNDSFYEEYQLKTKLMEDVYCTRKDHRIEPDTLDVIAAVILLSIVALNVLGSVYDHYSQNGKREYKLLLCFSLQRNWKALFHTEPDKNMNTRRLANLDGIRSINTALVILGHAPLASAIALNNAKFIESRYDHHLYQILYNGTLIVQTFFIMSGFLLVYNGQANPSKHKITWKTMPKALLKRWLRLTPGLACLLLISMTWIRHLGDGPMWKRLILTETEHCRRQWWWFLIYLNNYVDNSHCLSHGWYLGADMQLYCLGMILCATLQTPRARKVVLPVVFIIGSVIPMVVTYLYDLDAVLLPSPETLSTLFTSDRTFNEAYKRGHTNVTGYTAGLALGYLVQHLQATGFDGHKFKKYRVLYWLLFPGMLSIMLAGGIFYADAPRASLLVRTVFSLFPKPLFAIIVSLIILGAVFQIESTYRGILEKPWWKVTARLSFNSYLIHVTLIKFYVSMFTSLMTATENTITVLVTMSIIVSFLVAIPYHLMIEAPVANIVNAMLMKKQALKPSSSEKSNNIEKTD